MKIKLFCYLLLLCLTSQNTIKSQSYERNNSIDRFSLIASAGVFLYNDISDINSFLASNSFPEIRKISLGLKTIAFEIQTKKFIVRSSAFMILDNGNNYSSSEDYSFFENIAYSILFGYDLLPSKSISFFPAIAFDFGASQLELVRSNTNTEVEDFISSPNFVKMDHSFQNLRGEICFRSKLYNEFGFSLNLGYRHCIIGGNWLYRDIEFSQGPQLNLSGIYLNLGLMINSEALRKKFSEKKH